MKPGRLQEVTAAIWLGIGVINGATALNANNEAVRAEATAEAFQAQGNLQATEWQAYADDKEGDRNRYLLLVGLNLGTAACFGAAAAGSIASSRRREQEPQPDTSAQ